MTKQQKKVVIVAIAATGAYYLYQQAKANQRAQGR